MKEKLTVVLEIEQNQTLEVLAKVKEIAKPVAFSMEEIKTNDTKVGFAQ